MLTIILIIAGMLKPYWAGYYEYQIGAMYQNGIIVEADHHKALSWFHKSETETAKFGG